MHSETEQMRHDTLVSARQVSTAYDHNRVRRGSRRPRDEKGAILILALAFILVVSLITIALSTWATSDLNNTTNFATARSLNYSATSVTQIAMQSIRFNPVPSTTPTQKVPTVLNFCWQPVSGSVVSEYTFDNIPVAVWCTTTEDLSSQNTRVVTFTACKTTLTAGSTQAQVDAAGALCAASPTLTATVTYDDYPQGGGTPLKTQCTSSCGLGMTLNRWVWAHQ